MIANEHGWFMLNPVEFTAVWDGSDSPFGVRIIGCLGPEPVVTSHFGHGIITWRIPFLFRTSPGYNLYVRGPANMPKDAVAPLEGIVESDWATAPFTMNWKFTREYTAVRFESDEPICMIAPLRRGELGAVRPSVKPLHDEPSLLEGFEAWRRSRAEFNRSLASNMPASRGERWQKHYYLGRAVGGAPAPQHETRLRLQPFTSSQELPGGAGVHEGGTMPHEFSSDDLPLLNRMIAMHPELEETLVAVKRVSEGGGFPIDSFDALVERLGGEEALLTFRGQPLSLRSVQRHVPPYYFPISSERDFLAKVSDLQARIADEPSVLSMAPQTTTVEQAQAGLAAGAVPPPPLSSEEVFARTRSMPGNAGLAQVQQ